MKYGSSTITNAATPNVATVTASAVAPVLSFGFNTATSTIGTTAPSLFCPAASSITTTTAAPAVFGSSASATALSFGTLFGTKPVATPSTTATASLSGLSGIILHVQHHVNILKKIYWEFVSKSCRC